MRSAPIEMTIDTRVRRSAPVSPALNQDVEDLAFVIDGAP
jgi:hypothetical protein